MKITLTDKEIRDIIYQHVVEKYGEVLGIDKESAKKHPYNAITFNDYDIVGSEYVFEKK